MSDKPNPQVSVTGFWLAGLGMIVGLAILSLLLSWIPGALLNGLPLMVRIVIAIGLTAVPAILWLVIFMRQDRLEPEPRGYVFGLYVLGIVVGAGVLMPVVDFLQFATWGNGNNAMLAGFIEGILIGVLIYIGVRTTVMPTAEFDERVDGMIYAIAMGLGMATAEGISLVMSRDIRSLAAVSQIATIDTVIFVAVGIVVGFVMGMIRPGKSSGWIMIAGLLGSGVVWVGHDWVRQLLVRGLVAESGLIRVLPSIVVMVVVFGLFTWLLNRAYDTAPQQDNMQLPAGRGDMPVVILAVVCLLAAVMVRDQFIYTGHITAHGPLQVTLPRQMLPMRPGKPFPQVHMSGVQYDLQSAPSAGNLAQDAARVRLLRGANCRDVTQGETTIAIGAMPAMIQEYVCLPTATETDVQHSYQLIATVDKMTYSIVVTGPEKSATTVALYWQELLSRITAK
jgi:RsiW-degrading membrane proteinase PrsW (M82 family)